MKSFVPLLICLLLCGCGGRENPAPNVTPTPTPMPTPVVLSVCVDTEGSTIDPTYLSEPIPSELQSHLFEGLTKYAPEEGAGTVTDSVLCLGLAESVACSDDGLVYRFVLREDARWSDGEPVCSEDFVYAWRRLLSPPVDAEMAHAVGREQLYGVVKESLLILPNFAGLDTLLSVFNWKGIALAVVLWFIMKKWKTHPIAYIAIAAVVGMVFSF